MAWTRKILPFSSEQIARRCASARRVLPLVGLSVLVACAEAPDGSNPGDYTLYDSGLTTDPPAAEAGLPMLPADNGEHIVIPPSTPPSDAGGSKPMDASTPLETGVLKPADSSAPPPDTGSPAVVDAATDSGTTKPIDAAVDSGAKPDAAPSGQMCSATPAYPTATDCAKCTCSKCGSEVAACYAGSDSAQCASVQVCAETNHCASDACFCGTSVTCLFPDGQCKSVIETAAGSTELLDIQRARDDATSSVGRANAIGSCQQTNCRSECQL